MILIQEDNKVPHSFFNSNKSKVYIGQKVIDAADMLKVICTASTGTNHIDKSYAKEVVAAYHGKSKEANKQMQRRIAMKDPAGRKASLKKEEASMTPQELQLQKRKAMLDRMIAQKRQQGLNKAKKSEPPTKAMGEEAECAHSMKGKECPIHGKKDCSSMSEEASDAMKDRRMERGGVGGNQRYNKPVSNTPNTFGKKKPKYDGMSAIEKVKASIRAKHGQGAIMDTKKK